MIDLNGRKLGGWKRRFVEARSVRERASVSQRDGSRDLVWLLHGRHCGTGVT